MPVNAPATTPAARRRLHDRLRRETRAEVRFDRGRRGALRDRRQPLPDRADRRRRAADGRRRRRRPSGSPPRRACRSCPRGAATSLSGQTVGPAIVIDFSKYLNRIGVVDRDRMTVRVEPGVVLDQLNAHLKPLGLMFGPDVSTSDRATIGGMIGNNSAGARSLRYGKTVDHVRAVDVVLADGTPATLRPGRAPTSSTPSAPGADRVGRGPSRRPRHGRARTARRSPRSSRRSSGGSAATTSTSSSPACRSGPTGWLDEPWQFNLARLIVGSEGTLAVVTGGRAEGRADPAGAGAGRPLVRHDPRGARPAGRDRRDRARWPSRCSTG